MKNLPTKFFIAFGGSSIYNHKADGRFTNSLSAPPFNWVNSR